MPFYIVRDRARAKEGTNIHKKLEKASNSAKEIFKKTYDVFPERRLWAAAAKQKKRDAESKLLGNRKKKDFDADSNTKPAPKKFTTYLKTDGKWVEKEKDFGAGVKAQFTAYVEASSKLFKERKGGLVNSVTTWDGTVNGTVTGIVTNEAPSIDMNKNKAFNTMSVGELKKTKAGSYGTIPDLKTGEIVLFRLFRNNDHVYFLMDGTSTIYLRAAGLIPSGLWKNEEAVIKALRSKNYFIL